MSIFKEQRPNIVWISLEDTSPRFGCYGDPAARTPNMDRLASEGTIFVHAFSTAGVCAPSRAAVITGMYQTTIGAQHMRTSHTNRLTPEMPTPYEVVPPPYVKAFPEYLRSVGYYCTNNQKTDYQFEAPLTAWDECGSSAHWRHRDADQPFFAVFNPLVTHESGMWRDLDELPATDPDQLTLPPYLPNTRKARVALARHYDHIAQADAEVGSLLLQLKEDGLEQNTIVFLWSDHGEGLPRAKRWPYDQGIRVPMIVRWPGSLRPGTTDERLVSLVDLAPTVLSLAGVDIPFHFQGVPFLGDKHQDRPYVFAARDRYDESYDMVRAVRDSRYKYIRNYYPNQPYLQWIPYSHQHPVWQEMWRLHFEGTLTPAQGQMFQTRRPVEELYDCEADPFELDNLAGNPNLAATIERLRSELDRWMSQFGDFGHIPESQMVEQMWPGGVQPETARPIFLAITPSCHGREAAHEEQDLEGPVEVMIHCATQGASIAYTTDPSPTAPFKLYTGPVRLSLGETVLRAKAIRIGYLASREAQGVFRVR